MIPLSRFTAYEEFMRKYMHTAEQVQQPKYWVAVHALGSRSRKTRWKRRLFYDYNNALIYFARLRFRDEKGRRIPNALIKTNIFDRERADFPIF